MSSDTIYFDDSQLSYKNRAKAFIDHLPEYTKSYLQSLFPIIEWLPRYNLTWLTGDLVAGITIGAVVVPQGMAYAKLATLPVQYGLYSSFAGVFIYCFFATSKDITIGPVAVMSLLMAQILGSVTAVAPQYPAYEIAATLSLFAGVIALGIGLFRLGFIIDFISGPAIAGFMSGSALTIGISQIAGLFGVPNINTRDASYLVLGNSLGGLGHSKLDAAFGLVGLLLLYIIRHGSEALGKRYPKIERPLFFLNIARSVLLVIFSTLIAWGISRHNPANAPIKLNGTVPAGLQGTGVPKFDNTLLGILAPNFPVVVLILVLEHVAIAKSFGRLNDYVINPNQELIAIGVSNIIGSFFTAYPATGSFSRTAIKAKAGVRTPIAGIFSGIVVILALYALTPAFYFIPNATLSAIIIHAVADLFSGPKTWKMYWGVSPFEFFVFFIGVVITFFTTVEIGVYVSVAFSLLLLLIRIARPRFSILGRVPVSSENKDATHYIYVPIQNASLRASVAIEAPPPGIVVIRLEEAYTYPNAAFITDRIIDAVKTSTRRGGDTNLTKGQRAWNDSGLNEDHKDNLPLLRAVVIDFAAVSNIDSTAIQGLTVARATLDRYTGHQVEWHFANIADASIRRALITGGFGGPTAASTSTNPLDIAPALNDEQINSTGKEDVEAAPKSSSLKSVAGDVKTPFIHYDLDEAVQAAAANTK